MTKMAQPAQLEAIHEAVIRFFHNMNTHCPANVIPMLTPDVELLADDVANGHEAVNAYFLRLWDAYPCITFVTENIILGENGAAAEVTYQGGPGGAGARCMVFGFRGNLIRRVRCY